MKAVALVTTSLVVALAVSSVSQETGQVPEEAAKAPVEMNKRLDSPRREERIFAFYTTTSIKRLATTTITAISTCLSITMGAPGCIGRKKKSMFSSLAQLEDLSAVSAPQLEGSQSDEVDEEEPSGSHRAAREVEDRQGRKLTVWSSVISTLTVTSTSYLAGTTITATALCAAPGLTAGCFGK